MKVIYCVMIMICPVVSIGQDRLLNGLKPGSHLPAVTVSHILNYKAGSARLADFHKPLLLDFFETHCSGCISALQYLNKIQHHFADSLQVFVVCTEPADKISRFLSTNARVKDISLPFITGDTLLDKMFPHVFIPHEVWIDQNNIVQAITSSDYLNNGNIQNLVAGTPLQLPVKDDSQGYDTRKPLAVNAAGREETILYQSTITGFLDNAPSGFHSDASTAGGKERKICFINMLPLSICGAALGYRYMPNRFILNVKDSSSLIHDVKDGGNGWFAKHALCYEIRVPAYTSGALLEKHMMEDIGNATGLCIRIEKRNVPCYVLVLDSSERQKDPASKGGTAASLFFSQKGRQAFMQNELLGKLVTAMNSGAFGNTPPVVIDGTGYTKPVDMTLGTLSVKDISAMKKVLRTYGFNIIKQSRLLEWVVISDINIQNK